MQDLSENESLPKENSPLECVKELALLNTHKALASEEEFVGFLCRWWCGKYNRPYKDPLLLSYTVEELFLEFYECIYAESPEKSKESYNALLKFGISDVNSEEFEDARFKDILTSQGIVPNLDSEENEPLTEAGENNG